MEVKHYAQGTDSGGIGGPGGHGNIGGIPCWHGGSMGIIDCSGGILVIGYHVGMGICGGICGIWG